jgi:hypothetical protein
MGAPIGESLNWFNTWRRAAASGCTFCFFIGGRGIGKTFSYLREQREEFLQNNAGRLLYLRITAKELAACATESDNPYKDINLEYGTNVKFLTAGKAEGYRICDVVQDPESGQITHETQIGVARALSTFQNLRGVSFRDVTHIYFDEFIPRKGVRRTQAIREAGDNFVEAYETVNRNRELFGEPPVQCIFTANAFALDSSVLIKFNLVKIVQMMQERGQRRYTDRERSIYIELCEAPDIAEAKSHTALYKAMAGDEKFMALTLKNKFTDHALNMVREVPLNEYVPIVQYEGFTIFEHKATKRLHAAAKVDLCGQKYYDKTKQKFLRRYYTLLKVAIAENVITFDSADTYYRLESVLDKKRN